MSTTLRLLKEPSTLTYPVAPVPTESEICKTGGLIISKSLPGAVTSTLLIWPYLIVSDAL